MIFNYDILSYKINFEWILFKSREAGPLFNSCSSKYRIDKSDAHFVDTIHTDSGYFPYQGMKRSVSDADFLINGGNNQPGCNDHSWNGFFINLFYME